MGGEPLVRHAVRLLADTVSAGIVIVPAGERRAVADALGTVPGWVVLEADDPGCVDQVRELVGDEAVVVHDAFRPLTPRVVLDRVLAVPRPADRAVIPVAGVNETVKDVDADGWVTRTVPRESLRWAQTPKLIGSSALRAADTDWSRLAGMLPLDPAPILVDGHPDGFQVTDAADLELAEALLAVR